MTFLNPRVVIRATTFSLICSASPLIYHKLQNEPRRSENKQFNVEAVDDHQLSMRLSFLCQFHGKPGSSNSIVSRTISHFLEKKSFHFFVEFQSILSLFVVVQTISRRWERRGMIQSN
jgi:hypothetical protein